MCLCVRACMNACVRMGRELSHSQVGHVRWQGHNYVHSITQLCPIDVIATQTTGSASPVRKRSAQRWKS